MAIISTAEYKTWAGIADAGFDTRLGVLIPAVQAALETACGRAFDSTVYTDEAYDGNGERSLWLPQTPIAALTVVKIKASDGTTDTVDTGDYRHTSIGELHRLAGGDYLWGNPVPVFGGENGPVWPVGVENILVTYTAGYSAMPTDLQLLMYTLVDAALDNAGESWMLGSTGDGQESKSFLSPADMATRYAQLIAPWRRKAV
jgi:hypothetical protein